MENLRKRARRLRITQSKAEARLWQALRGRRFGGWKFRRQHPIDRFIVDFVTIEGKLIIEVDGATHSTEEELARDAERTKILQSLGFQVVRVTNRDIYDDLPGVLDFLLNELKLPRR